LETLTPEYSTLSDYQKQCLPASNLARMQAGKPIVIVPETDEHYRNYFNQKIEVKNDVKTYYREPKLFSYYKKPVKNITPYKAITLLQAFNVITKYFKEQTEKIRSIQDEKEQAVYKANNFDYITFSGVFSERGNEKLITHSGFLCLDFDKLTNVSELKNRILSDENIDTELLFTSPRGNGLKWITTIDLSEGSHLEYFTTFQRYFFDQYGITIDKQCKDVARACFLSYDPAAVINPKYLQA
jgi:hypothetical protein